MSYWDNVCKIYKQQSLKGLETYGQTLEENLRLPATDRLTYLEEELVDALMYIEHIKAGNVLDVYSIKTMCEEFRNIIRNSDLAWKDGVLIAINKLESQKLEEVIFDEYRKAN